MVQTEFDLYIERDRSERQKRINYYIKEVNTPTVIEDDKEYTRKEKRQFRKWLKQKRKEYKKYFKNWAPWDLCYLYVPIKMVLKDMFEYYKNRINVWSYPIVTDDEGNVIQKDDRRQTLAQALALLEMAEFEEDYGNYEDAEMQFVTAFSYIAMHMKEWWD